jgi:hypothetical protein
MSRDDGPRVDPYEVVEAHWPYDGPYSDELTAAAVVMIGRLGRYLNNATQKRDGLPYIAVVGRIVGNLHGAVAGYEQLLVQLAGYLDREAEANPSVYDDRYDRPGAVTAREVAADLRDDVLPAFRLVADALEVAARGGSHLGSD